LKAVKVKIQSFLPRNYLLANGMTLLEKKNIADATMNKLVHYAHRFLLQGESMRKKRGNLTNDVLIKKVIFLISNESFKS
jgi:hypothetical protein